MTSLRCSTAAVRHCARLLILITLTPAVLAGEGRTFAEILHEYKARNPDAGENKYRVEGPCDKSCILAALPPLSDTVYTHTLSALPRWEDVCATTASLTAEPQDGFGGEVLSRISMRAGALEHGHTYVHTPFVELDHVGGQEAIMETFVNLGADEIDIRQIESEFVVIGTRSLDYSALGDPGCSLIHAAVNTDPCRKGATPANLAASMPVLRKRYRASPKPALPFEAAAYIVAVHLRRGDVLHLDHRKKISEDAILAAMSAVRATVEGDGSAEGRPVRFHVFTQGSPGELPELESRPNTTARHGATTPEMAEAVKLAFHSFVMADAFIAAPSSFSYAAALLSEGRVFAFNHDRSHLDNYTFVDDAGTFTPVEAAKSFQAAPQPCLWAATATAISASAPPASAPTPPAPPTSPTSGDAAEVPAGKAATQAAEDAVAGGMKQLANLTSAVTTAMGSAVGNFSLNQTVDELSAAASIAIQDPTEFGSELVKGGQPTSVYTAIGAFFAVVLLIAALTGSSKKLKSETEDGGDDVENPKERLLSAMANVENISSVNSRPVSKAPSKVSVAE
eukprot:CAMPEP_0118957624 /NCGR_PEP_ID=MMETSP1169-20130426/62201_1 /TAXON_ID=36882 /ORGANISM="Pyramimonas obovata, Strain CCMP722" /LENGTH=565 /DNA_ID=CAMNT_0006905713 /DNA_START=811 /DNA_END=2508 /DNA_ORIENTATION=-